jgi:hypothetical protein
MKTGQDVHEVGLYVSNCCLQELRFDRNESFSRCPRCLRLCEWEFVDMVLSAHEVAQQNSDAPEMA